MCTRAKVECELIVQDWASCSALNAGKFDLVLTLGIDEKRKQVVDFTSLCQRRRHLRGPQGCLDGKMPMTGERLDLNDKAQKADPVMAEIGGS